MEREVTEREQRVNALEDENRKLKAPPTPQPPKPAAKKKSWLAGATFFSGDD